MRILPLALTAVMFASLASFSWAADPWVAYPGGEGPGAGKHIVLVSGDDEYRSEEMLPALGMILSERHGFKCTVLFPIDPKSGEIAPTYQTNIPGAGTLADADLMILFTRFRNLPAEQMEPVLDYLKSGKPIIALRTATHAFNFPKDSPYAKYSWNNGGEFAGGFGRQILGETWVSHHGHHGSESTRGVINPELKDHPILRGVSDIWGPTDVYGIKKLPETAEVLVRGQILTGMQPTDPPVEDKRNDPMMPIIWLNKYTNENGAVTPSLTSTFGSAVDFKCEDYRRLLVNASYYFTGLTDKIDGKANVEFVGDYEPTFFGFGKAKTGTTPANYELKK
ncbi:ThuA domain-containing protein [Blastopirellula sp. JC732]|uniref:ThuA domain-containing protein n=1 Tax=Blastopirellula sediminis TaxID=2894196 RepID=A0A9X1MQL3_9BACT|nr:ThuA domain-containing protein [Blastopirellula sediminis]MCC9605032.1 ThuA domain-containing protein [Blastopirellula sediminis]MCC9631668.1 ThuA domain-containing protein [Blastopirellula sediminis]